MWELFRQHQKKILIILFILVLVRFINVVGHDRTYNKAEELIIDLIKPALVIVNNVKNFFGNTLEVIMNYQQVKEENQILRKKLTKLEYKEKEMKKINQQNKRFREFLNFKEYAEYETVGASVIGHSADNLSQVIIIDQGSKAGIRRKMPVVGRNGYLLGVIKQVSSYTAQVLLLADSSFVTGGLIRREESRNLGVVKGQGNSGQLLMDNLSWDADVKKGDIIVTSGLSKYCPKGLPIGKVISVSPDNYGLTQAATIVPFLKVNKAEEILVVTDFSTKNNLLTTLEVYPNLEGEK